MVEAEEFMVSVLYGVAIAISMFVLFYLLSLVCDEALAPSLEELSEFTKLPHDVACATFLAFGSSAPEISINCTAAFLNSGTEIGVGALMGSALISFCIIPAAILFVFKQYRCFVIRYSSQWAFFALWNFSSNGEINLQESTVLCLLYICYLMALRFLSQFYSHSTSTHHFIPPPQPASSPTNNNDNSDDYEKGTKAASEEVDEESNSIEPSWPFHAYVLPPFCYRSAKQIEAFWPRILLFAFIYVCLISAVVLQLALELSSTLKLSGHLTGLVVVAFGAELPDLFASMSVARQGEGPSSIAATTGSQVTNIFIGVGVPYVLSNLYRKKSVSIQHEPLAIYYVGSIVGLFLFLAFRRYPSVCLTKTDAYLLIAAYSVVILSSATLAMGKTNTI